MAYDPVRAATNLTLVTQNGNVTVEDTSAGDELVAANLSVTLYGAETVFEQLAGSRISASNQAGVAADKMKLAGQIAGNTVQLQPHRRVWPWISVRSRMTRPIRWNCRMPN